MYEGSLEVDFGKELVNLWFVIHYWVIVLSKSLV